jgi:hypothetical protein
MSGSIGGPSRIRIDYTSTRENFLNQLCLLVILGCIGIGPVFLWDSMGCSRRARRGGDVRSGLRWGIPMLVVGLVAVKLRLRTDDFWEFDGDSGTLRRHTNGPVSDNFEVVAKFADIGSVAFDSCLIPPEGPNTSGHLAWTLVLYLRDETKIVLSDPGRTPADAIEPPQHLLLLSRDIERVAGIPSQAQRQ